jgi:DNA-binding transcriptional LysR family regulator
MISIITMLHMHLEDVRALVAVAESGSISGAAIELHQTQPTVTRRIQRLEAELGMSLIDRRRRPFTLTDRGRATVERGRRLLRMAHDFRSSGDGDPVPARELRVGVAHALTELTLTDPVDIVRRDFPEAVLRLQTGWSRELLARVHAGALDAAIILQAERDGPPSGVEADLLAREHLVVIGPKAWPRRSFTIQDLRDVSWVLNPEGCAARAGLQRELARAEIPLRIGVETYSYELQMRLIARGRGLGLVPSRLVRRSPTRKRLRQLTVPQLQFPQVIWMVRSNLGTGPEPALAALQRGLVERLTTPK